MRPTAAPVLLATLLAATTLTACGSGSGSDPDTVKVSFKQSTDNSVRVMDTYLGEMKKQFEKANPGKKVELVPIKAPDSEYYTKLQQMLRSPKTAPDLVYEDTFLINSDITSGYLKPLDPYLDKWSDWGQFIDTAKAAAKAQDGKTYGVPDGTDTRGLWFDKGVFAKAGLPADWQPKTWDDVLDAARTIKKKVPGVTPLNVYTGKPAGEAATMQGFEMLLYGTGDGTADPLYDTASKKWVVGSQAFKDALTFVETVYKEKLGPDVTDALDPNFATSVRGDLLPGGKLGIDLDGSWLPQDWLKGSGHEWPAWSRKLGLAHMPTQHGQAPGKVSMSGGWTWSIPSKAATPPWPSSSSRRCRRRRTPRSGTSPTPASRSARTSPPTRPTPRRSPASSSSRTSSPARTTGPPTRRTRRCRPPSRRRWRASRPGTVPSTRRRAPTTRS